MSETPNGAGVEPGSTDNDLLARSIAIHDDPRFTTLKRRLRMFIFPMSIAFFSWYLLYVLMSAFARDFMATVLFGNVNVALVFGLLQFVTTFGVAILYAQYANRRIDPLATELREELTSGTDGGALPIGTEDTGTTTRGGRDGGQEGGDA